jgi:hypothetical protein
VPPATPGDPTTYERGDAPLFTRIASRRDGCISAIEPIVENIAPLGLSRALERAPAVRGSVALPAFAAPKALEGTLSIQLNDNGAIADIAAPVVVPVAFAAATYSARDVARRIHDELWARGIGQAAAYPDGTVVIESGVNGLAGSVRIPAPGTGTAGADRTLLQNLIGPAAELFGRGYPGVGFNGPLRRLRNGGRSRQGNATADATWVFQSGAAGPSTAAIAITSGQTLADIQRAVDAALASVAGRRIGMCLLGPDDTLYVEQVGPNDLMLRINGYAGTDADLIPANNPGETPEWRPDPAIGLRFTNIPRTVRYARDRFGNRNEGEFDDCGWARIPLHTQFGTTGGSLAFPGGVYWTALRTDGSKTRDFDSTGEMIASGGVDPADATRAFVHRARYWIGTDGGQPLRIVRHSSGEFLLEVLW